LDFMKLLKKTTLIITITLQTIWPNSIYAQNANTEFDHARKASLTQKKHREIKTILIKDISVSNHDYSVALKTNSFISPVESDLNSIELNKNHKELLSLLKKAKFYQLQNEDSLAYPLYLEISHMAYLHHWNKLEKEIIHYSFLKLSELSAEKQHYWINQALIFMPQKSIDKYDLSNSTLREYNKQLQQISFLKVLIPEEFYLYRLILINGEKVSLQQLKKMKFPKGTTIKLSLLSNSYAPVHRNLSVSDLKNYITQPTLLVSGQCDSPEISESYLPKQPISVLFKDHCFYKAPNKNKSLQTRLMQSPQAIAKKSSEQSLLKNKWLWLGFALIAGAYFSQSKSTNNNSSHASNTMGKNGPNTPKITPPITYKDENEGTYDDL
jgi:hypothetical protein